MALGGALLLLGALFMGLRLGPPWGFVISLRATRLAALLLVGASLGVATALFQAATRNRILTPGILGFDSLFVLLQTVLVMTLGATGRAAIPAALSFAVEAALMMGAAVALFGALLLRGPRDVTRMLLAAVVAGTLLRSLSALAARLIDPSEFAVVQGATLATFGPVDGATLAMAAALAVPALVAALRLAPAVDVLALGRDRAVGLGLAHDRLVLGLLLLVAALTAAATALVGPVTFLGLLATAVARAVVPTHRHALLLPATAAVGALCLVAGQTVFERLLGLQSSLAVVVELLGGLLFLALVMGGRGR